MWYVRSNDLARDTGGKGVNAKKEYIRLGETAACMMRGVTDTCDDYSYIEPLEDP